MEPKCPFTDAILGVGFGCRHAQGVTVRTGPSVHCQRADALARCGALEQALRRAGIPAFGVADDLAAMPQSVLVKVHCGGLLGLADRVGPREAVRIADIDAVMQGAEAAYGGVEAIPCGDLVASMTAYKLRRRRHA